MDRFGKRVDGLIVAMGVFMLAAGMRSLLKL